MIVDTITLATTKPNQERSLCVLVPTDCSSQTFWTIHLDFHALRATAFDNVIYTRVASHIYKSSKGGKSCTCQEGVANLRHFAALECKKVGERTAT